MGKGSFKFEFEVHFCTERAKFSVPWQEEKVLLFLLADVDGNRRVIWGTTVHSLIPYDSFFGKFYRHI